MANTHTKPNTPDSLTVAQVAAAMQCHPETVRRLINAGSLAAVRWGGQYRISVSEFERAKREGALASPEPAAQS